MPKPLCGSQQTVENFKEMGIPDLLTCILISQEAGDVVWYSHLFQNFTLFVVISMVKGFGIVNKAEIVLFFLELSCSFRDPTDVDNLISGSSAFLNPA